MNTLHDCKEELNEAHLKATPVRLAVLALLEKSDQPLAIGSIINYLKDNHIKADPATVFRVVNTFTEKGIARQIQFKEGKFRYELFSRPEHHHLICESCGAIEDISDCSIGALESEIAKKKKFLIQSHSLEFFGICKNCQTYTTLL